MLQCAQALHARWQSVRVNAAMIPELSVLATVGWTEYGHVGAASTRFLLRTHQQQKTDPKPKPANPTFNICVY
jgi:hypothetical protein